LVLIKGLCVIWIGIGLIYNMLGEYENALKYYERCRDLYEEIGDGLGIAKIIVNIAGVYFKQGNYSEALAYYEEALGAYQKLSNKRGEADSHTGIGIVHKMLNNPVKALESYQKALAITKEIGDKRSMLMNMNNLGSLYIQQGEWKKSIIVILEALELSEELGTLEAKRDAHFNLSEVYRETGQYQEAFNHYKDYSMVKDSMFNESKSKEIGRLEAKFEFERHESERKLLDEAQAKQVADSKARRDNLQYSGILILLVLVFAGVFMLGRFNIPVRMAEGMIFFSFLLIFEFMLVMLDPYIENYSGGEPAYKLLFNAVLAGLIFPLHAFFESKMKGRLADNGS